MLQARNVFCAVRPPGHHAGPNGIVTNENDATGSHGFCLLNNVAIAAAHAMNLPNAGSASQQCMADLRLLMLMHRAAVDITDVHLFLHLDIQNPRVACMLTLKSPAGLKKVAILDFDVHHGNGTQACVGAVMPFNRTETWGTLHSKGSITTPVFRPWLDWDDNTNIFFGRYCWCKESHATSNCGSKAGHSCTSSDWSATIKLALCQVSFNCS